MSNKRSLTILITFICTIMTSFILSSCKTNTEVVNEDIKVLHEQVDSDLLTSSGYKGYTVVEYEGEREKGDSFLACGTGGMLSRIYTNGNIESIMLPNNDKDLTSILVGKGVTLVSGRSGVLFYSSNGQKFTKCKNVTDSDIVGLTMFKNKYFAAAADGDVYVSDDGKSWLKCAELPMNGIISLASTDKYISMITSATDIFISTNGIDWNQQNFNDAYEGYYDKYVFTKIVDDGPSLAILGHLYDNSKEPVLMMSDNGGEVWAFRSLSEINNMNAEEFYPLSINQVVSFTGQTLAICDKGRLLTLTNCVTCNIISEVGEKELQGLAINDSMSALVAVGEDFEFVILDAIEYRQDKIKAEQVLEDFMNHGALIIDVRSEEEYNELHITGSLHIPLDQVESQLRNQVPDQNTEIIFYCASGKRSQAALEIAQQLGYPNIFNLGGIEDWPYETEGISKN